MPHCFKLNVFNGYVSESLPFSLRADSGIMDKHFSPQHTFSISRHLVASLGVNSQDFILESLALSIPVAPLGCPN